MADLQIDPTTGDVDGGDESPGVYTPMPLDGPIVVPEDPWDRLYLAAELGLSDPLLLTKLKAETLALFTPRNLITLAVILAAWAGFTLVGGPVAWVANFGLGALGLYQIAQQAIDASRELGNYALQAYPARTEEELREAGRHFTAAMVELGDLVITTAFSTAAFKLVRRAVVARMKVPEAPRREPLAERAKREKASKDRAEREKASKEQAEREKASKEQTERQRERAERERAQRERLGAERDPIRQPLPDVVMGAGAGRAAEELGNAADKFRQAAVPVVVGGLGLIVAVGLAAFILARKTKKTRRNDG